MFCRSNCTGKKDVTTCFVNMLLYFIVVLLVYLRDGGINFAVLPYLIPVMLTE